MELCISLLVYSKGSLHRRRNALVIGCIEYLVHIQSLAGHRVIQKPCVRLVTTHLISRRRDNFGSVYACLNNRIIVYDHVHA